MSMDKIATAAPVNMRADNFVGSLTAVLADGIKDWGPSVSFTKVSDDSLLLIFARSSGYHTKSGGSGIGYFWVQIDGTDYRCGGKNWSQSTASHSSYSADVSVGGIPAGTYTIQFRAETSTSGTLTANASDTVSFAVMEAGSATQGALPRLRGVAANTQPSSGSTTSTSYIDIGLSKSFTKLSDDSHVIAFIQATAYGGAASIPVATWAVEIDGTDYQIAHKGMNQTSNHKTYVGVDELTGIDAGTYTVELRVKINTGTLAWDGGDTWSFMLLEVPG